jgi:putative nucleotidyltransferase with HDIG domain
MARSQTSTLDSERITEAISRIEPLPVSLTRLAQLVASPDLDIEGVIEVIEVDPVLTGGVLKTANSAAARGARRVLEVREATIRLGVESVLLIAMGGALAARRHGHDPSQSRDRWVHSAGALFAAEAIMAETPGLPPAFLTAALLHDVGELMEEEAPEIAELIGDHGRIGAVVTHAWQLPDEVSRAILDHHDPDLDDRMAVGVMLADIVAHQVAGEDEPSGTSVLLSAVGADNSAYPTIVDRTTERVRWLEERFFSAGAA